MKKVHQYSFLIPILLSMLVSCTEGPEGVPGPERLTGDGEGRVTVLDEFLDSDMDPGGVTVTAIGYDHEITATSDAGGEYLLTGMQTGHYRIEFEKEGFGKQVVFHRFLGGEKPEAISGVELVELSSTVVEEFDLRTDWGYIICDGIISPAPTESAPRSVILYFDQNDDVSNSSYVGIIPLWDFQIDSTVFHCEIPLGSADFPSGTTTYMVAYGLSSSLWDGGSSYYDEQLEKYIINVNPVNSKRASVYIP